MAGPGVLFGHPSSATVVAPARLPPSRAGDLDESSTMHFRCGVIEGLGFRQFRQFRAVITRVSLANWATRLEFVGSVTRSKRYSIDVDPLMFLLHAQLTRETSLSSLFFDETSSRVRAWKLNPSLKGSRSIRGSFACTLRLSPLISRGNFAFAEN